MNIYQMVRTPPRYHPSPEHTNTNLIFAYVVDENTFVIETGGRATVWRRDPPLGKIEP
jgi:hypothetical protein